MRWDYLYFGWIIGVNQEAEKEPLFSPLASPPQIPHKARYVAPLHEGCPMALLTEERMSTFRTVIGRSFPHE